MSVGRKKIKLLAAAFLALGAMLCCGTFPCRAEEQLPVLRTIAEVRQLTPQQAALQYPVHVRGVVTIWDPPMFTRMVQDETAGIYLNLFSGPSFTPGQIIEVEGVSGKGDYAPIIVPTNIHLVAEGIMPEAKPVTFEQLASGQEDSQFVEIRGIVRHAYFTDSLQHSFLAIATGDGRLVASTQKLTSGKLEDLIDSVVRVRGVCLSRFNRQRQLFQLLLILPRPTDLTVMQPAPKDPFAAPTERIGSLLQFRPEGVFGHRVKVAGTVIYRRHSDALYIESEGEGVYVPTKQTDPLLVGDRIEILGFPAKGEYNPMLEDSVFRKIGSGPVLFPKTISTDEALKGNYDCRLVQMEAILLDRGRNNREQFLVLQAGGFIFHARMEKEGGGSNFAYLENGSKVLITGVCLVEAGNEWTPDAKWRAKSFDLLMRSPHDLQVLSSPPWWTLQKLLWALAILGGVMLGALAWVIVLRQRVSSQTRIIRQKLQDEATLKERYEDLLENANDVVYTHDLEGRITSMNKAGESLLQRPREEILSRSILEFVSREQQPAAQAWLEQLSAKTAALTVEWDFSVGPAQKIKVEISARLLQQQGRNVEVEVIARDISERKRLEREILEISNREQRRIGHDLHDGVCQQLVGIGFLADTLADQLQEKGVSECAQAERISSLIKEAAGQTRGVARGLFPVRLEENGLPSALEELAGNSSELFKIGCRFLCKEPPVLLDNTHALHLYYIALEAVANAAKHGKAKNVVISLEPCRDRYALSVKDDGLGFVSNSKPQSGMGIRIMCYRAGVIGATLTLQSEPGCGAQVTCLFQAVSQEAASKSGETLLEHYGQSRSPSGL